MDGTDTESMSRIDQAATGFETTEFTTDGGHSSIHQRSKAHKYAVDFKRDGSLAAEAENYSRQLRKDSEEQAANYPTEDLENLYTTEMEEGEENDLKASKSIIRSELKDGSINDHVQPLSYHINVGPEGHPYAFYTMKNIVDDQAKNQT